MNKAASIRSTAMMAVMLTICGLMYGIFIPADVLNPQPLNQLGYSTMVDDSTKTELARSYFSKAASQNYPPAIYNLAVLDDMQGNHSAAATGFLKAAKLMLPEAACQIGVIYSVGIGLPQNDLQAYRWLLFGLAYASYEDRDFWLWLKDGVETRLSKKQITSVQKTVGKMKRKITMTNPEASIAILRDHETPAKYLMRIKHAGEVLQEQIAKTNQALTGLETKARLDATNQTWVRNKIIDIAPEILRGITRGNLDAKDSIKAELSKHWTVSDDKIESIMGLLDENPGPQEIQNAIQTVLGDELARQRTEEMWKKDFVPTVWPSR